MEELVGGPYPRRALGSDPALTHMERVLQESSGGKVHLQVGVMCNRLLELTCSLQVKTQNLRENRSSTLELWEQTNRGCRVLSGT